MANLFSFSMLKSKFPAMTVISFFAESAMTDLSKAIGSLQSNQVTKQSIG